MWSNRYLKRRITGFSSACKVQRFLIVSTGSWDHEVEQRGPGARKWHMTRMITTSNRSIATPKYLSVSDAVGRFPRDKRQCQ